MAATQPLVDVMRQQFTPGMVFAVAFCLALAPRLVLAVAFPAAYGDGTIYFAVADNIRLNGCVSISPPETGACIPHWGGNQFPGYPAFIAIVHIIFGANGPWVQVIQSLAQALAIANLAMMVARVTPVMLSSAPAVALLCLSPATLAWSRWGFTESVTTTLAILLLSELIRWVHNGQPRTLLLGAILGAAIFVRYDAVVLAIPIVVVAVAETRRRGLLRLAAVFTIALLPFGAWAARNVAAGLTPIPSSLLAPVGWRAPDGYAAWWRTWLIDQFDHPTVAFPVFSGHYSALRFPDQAFRNAEEKLTVADLIERLQLHEGKSFPVEIDHAFASLARERRMEAPIKTLLVVPTLRGLAMWASPFASGGWPAAVDEKTRTSVEQGGLLAAGLRNPLAALIKLGNLAYRLFVAAGVLSLLVLLWSRMPRLIRVLGLAAVALALARTGGLALLGLSETRYLTPVFPFLEVFLGLSAAAAWVSRDRGTAAHRAA